MCQIIKEWNPLNRATPRSDSFHRVAGFVCSNLGNEFFGKFLLPTSLQTNLYIDDIVQSCIDGRKWIFLHKLWICYSSDRINGKPPIPTLGIGGVSYSWLRRNISVSFVQVMNNYIIRPNTGLNIYVEPGYITTCVPSGMKLVDFHPNKPVYEFNFNGREMRCNSITHAVEIMMTQILARNGMRWYKLEVPRVELRFGCFPLYDLSKGSSEESVIHSERMTGHHVMIWSECTIPDKSITLNQIAILIEGERYESTNKKYKVNNVTAIIGPNFHNRRGSI